MDQKLDLILQKLGTIETDIGGMKSDIAELKADVAVLKGDVAVLKSDVAVLKVEVAGLKTDVAGLKEDVAGLKTDVQSLKTRVDVLESNQLTFLKELREQRLEAQARERLFLKEFDCLKGQVLLKHRESRHSLKVIVLYTSVMDKNGHITPNLAIITPDRPKLPLNPAIQSKLWPNFSQL